MIIDAEQYLEHHGVKGQKWGVRRARARNAQRKAQGRRQLKTSQYVGNTATRGAAYVAAYMLGSAGGSLVAQLGLGSGASGEARQAVAAVGSTVGSVLGVVATNKMLTRVGSKRVLDVLAED